MKNHRSFMTLCALPVAFACGGVEETSTLRVPDQRPVPGERPAPGDEPGPPSNTIVDVATQAGFSTLVQAAVDTGLAGALSGPGPITVFAPTNDAFADVALPENPDLLANILLHHVVAGNRGSREVLSTPAFMTLAGTSIGVDVAAGTIGGAPLADTLDVVASNGIIHVLDGVMIPPTIFEAAVAVEDLGTLAVAVSAASPGVASTLDGPGPITVFAPVNSAFAKVSQEDINRLLANQSALDDVLGYHVVSGQTLSTDLSDGQVIQMSNESELVVNVAGDTVSLRDLAGQTVNVIGADIRLANGVVHLVDTVLSPETF